MLLLHIKFFLLKMRSVTSFLSYFLDEFWRKMFLLLYSINWPYVIVWLPCNCFAMSYILLSYQVVFLHNRKSQGINILRRNGTFKMKLKALFIAFYRSFTEANKTNFLRTWESHFKVNDLITNRSSWKLWYLLRNKT